MAALVQSFPSPASTLTMLQTRPTSSDAFQNGSQSQQHQRNSQMPRNIYNTSVGGMAAGNYRGHTSISPVVPYAFTSTSVMPNTTNPLRQHPTAPLLRQENRTTSAPTIPFAQQITSPGPNLSTRHRLQQSPSLHLDLSSAFPLSQQSGSKDDASLPSIAKQNPSRPVSSIELNSPSFTAPVTYANVSKPSPDRYRRNHRRIEQGGTQAPSILSQGGSALPSGSGMATVGHLYSNPLQSSSTPTLTSYPAFRGTQSSSQNVNDSSAGSTVKLLSADDMNLPRQSSVEQAKRYRRRSISSLEVKEHTGQALDVKSQVPVQLPVQQKTYAAALAGTAPPDRTETLASPTLQRPPSSHARNNSTGSTSSGRTNSRPSSSKQDGASTTTASPVLQAMPITKNEAKLVNIPPRGSSDAYKRLATPSPLSKPMAMSPEKATAKDSFSASKPLGPSLEPSSQASATQNSIPESPAAQHLAALNKKDEKKVGKPSRLRRAFSFGSAAELRKASAENNMNNNLSNERAKLRKERYQDAQDVQAAIAQKQEAAGLGEGIYSGQGHFFTGSTDNLSISSTASSASVMIRKMGKGMKKGSRSLVGLFRPKSVVGVPAAESAVPEPSIAQVSMVTVEAEREKVNVNVNPHDQVGGGTGFPKLERNSIDAASLANEPQAAAQDFDDNSHQRRSIVGGERERAEVLAAVKKGILKRTATGSESGNSSPVTRPIDSKPTDFHVPQLPSFNESPRSSSPSTPTDEAPRLGHRRTDSVAIEGDDYFLSLAKFASGESKSIPGTPRSIAARNISFSPRIQFHDTWPSGEYDRRGEIATCNRLTPMLAQQIKEELNTFKMEMEVHEQSKVYTHFF